MKESVISEKDMPSVCIILVNYNGFQDTKECIASLKEINYPNYEIVVVDNDSPDREQLSGDTFICENAKIIFAEKNDGFSEGNNIGIEYAKQNNADYVLLLNNDTVVTENFLDELVKVAEADGQTAIVTGNIKYYYDKDSYWYIGGSYFRRTGYTIMTTYAKDTPEVPAEVTFATGCLMLIRMDYIKKYNALLSNDYFLYSEDVDYCCQAIDRGYRIMWTPHSLIYHKVNSSIGKSSKIQQYYFVRNYLIAAKRFGTLFPLAYITRVLLSCWEMTKYHFSYKIVLDGLKDYHRGIVGRSSKY